MTPTRNQRRALEKQNAQLPQALQQIPPWSWPTQPEGLVEVWRSRDFLVQIYTAPDSYQLFECESYDAQRRPLDRPGNVG